MAKLTDSPGNRYGWRGAQILPSAYFDQSTAVGKGLKVWSGTQWVLKAPKVWDGSGWVDGMVMVATASGF